MVGVRLLKQQQLVEGVINRLGTVTMDRRVRKYLQKLKEEIKHLKDLEEEDYEQVAAGKGDDLPCQELGQRVEEAIQWAED